MTIPSVTADRRRVRSAATPPAPSSVQPEESDAISAIPEEVALDGHAYITKRAALRHFTSMNRDERRAWLKSEIVQASKISRQQHYKAFADAYATFAQLRQNPDFEAAIRHAAVDLGRTINARTSTLRLILELFISYDDGGDDADSTTRRLATNLYARDTTAVRTLMKRGVLPSKVVELSRNPGEGFDTWGRWKPTSEPARAPIRRKPRASSLTSKPVSDTSDPWADVKVGNTVLAKFERAWYEARVTKCLENGRLRLAWCDPDGHKPFELRREQIALLRPPAPRSGPR